jgi:hypothetical protein
LAAIPTRFSKNVEERDGAAGFNLRVLEISILRKDVTKQDYSGELSIMKLLWEEAVVC